MKEIHPNSERMIRNGDVAPDFTLQDNDGGLLKLSEAVNSSPLVILFYRGDW
jgi:peroxiredoxin